MHKRIVLLTLLVLILATPILAGCSSSNQPEAPHFFEVITSGTANDPIIMTCPAELTIKYHGVNAPKGIPTVFRFTADIRQSPDKSLSVWMPQKEYQRYAKAVAGHMAYTNAANQAFAQLIPTNFGQAYEVYRRLQQQHFVIALKSEDPTYTPTCKDFEDFDRLKETRYIIFARSWTGDASNTYSASLNTEAGQKFVTLKTPNESIVKYSFPKEYYEDALNGIAPDLTGGQIVSFEKSYGADAFVDMVLSQLTTGGNYEAVYFRIAADDMEGRRQLPQAFTTALAVSAAQFDSPVYAVVVGYLANGQRVASEVVVKESSVTTSTWHLLSGSSTTNKNLSTSTSTDLSMYRLVEGSIYLIPIPAQ